MDKVGAKCSPVIQIHAGVMAILEYFGLSELIEDFKRRVVHEVRNLLSLELNLYRKFNNLDLWFQSTPQVCCSETRQLYQLTMCGSPAATKSVCPTSIPRDISASPRVLNPMSIAPPLWLSSSLHNEAAPPPVALHAICARVAHKSSAIDF